MHSNIIHRQLQIVDSRELGITVVSTAGKSKNPIS